jgi:hypothetical protein
MQSAARILGVRLLALAAETESDVAAAFAALVEQHAGALVISSSLFPQPVTVCAADSRRERVWRGQRLGRDFRPRRPVSRHRDWDLLRHLAKAPGSSRHFHRARETVFAQDCVVGLAGLEPATKRL